MNKFEEKTTKALLGFLKDEKPIPKPMAQARVNYLIWALVLAVVGTVFAENDRLSQLWGWLVFTLSGVLLGAGLYQTLAIRQWPIVKKHLSVNSLEKALSDKET